MNIVYIVIGLAVALIFAIAYYCSSTVRETVCVHDWQYIQPPTALRPLGGIVECKKCGCVDTAIVP